MFALRFSASSGKSDLPLFFLRVGFGLFLFLGAAEVLSNGEGLAACVAAWERVGVAAPHLFTLGSVITQVLCGAFLLIGYFTRLSGLLQGLNGIVITGVSQPPANAESALLVVTILLLCLFFAARGGGTITLDRVRTSTESIREDLNLRSGAACESTDRMFQSSSSKAAELMFEDMEAAQSQTVGAGKAAQGNQRKRPMAGLY